MNMGIGSGNSLIQDNLDGGINAILFNLFKVVPEVGLEPTRLAAGDFESPASTIPPLGHNADLSGHRQTDKRKQHLARAISEDHFRRRTD